MRFPVNAPEKKLIYMAVILLAVGVVVRILPWGLPSIESFQVGDSVIVPVEKQDELSEERSNLEYADDKRSFVDKVTSVDSLYDNRNLKKDRVSKSRVAPKLPIHVNSASVDELCALKGVGPKLAEKIIAVREASGPYRTPSDLQKVPGIGKKKLESLLSGVIFD